MKVIRQSIVCMLLIISVTPTVSAGSFKDWLLGPQASVQVQKAELVVLDTVSEECMQCHRNRGSSHIVVKSADSPMQFSVSGRQANHPVGMNYDQFVVSQPASYRPRSRLNPNISFANGQVTCLSCHEQKDNERGRLHAGGSNTRLVVMARVVSISANDMCTAKKTLTVGPNKSDLCVSCHAM